MNTATKIAQDYRDALRRLDEAFPHGDFAAINAEIDGLRRLGHDVLREAGVFPEGAVYPAERMLDMPGELERLCGAGERD